ncbi:MAG: hypothetical protein HYR63_03080 [Proteobacteria bacterium]|nr:hypothetical protein [Pseudomonadota bacterium]MBI3498445.1 hypothetical protein [Pseudomonadota bacterium]
MQSLNTRERKAVGWVAVAIMTFLGFEWWAADQNKERIRETLHRVCEAARRQNETLLGHTGNLADFDLKLSDAGKIAPVLQPIFSEGCGSPIPTED